jgi:hypothetical protein
MEYELQNLKNLPRYAHDFFYVGREKKFSKSFGLESNQRPWDIADALL